MTDIRYPQDEINFAKTMLACPWYRGEGSCVNGCTTEPYCETGCPSEGWFVIAEAEPLDEVEAAWSWHMGPDR